jgi:hypothetical protein
MKAAILIAMIVMMELAYPPVLAIASEPATQPVSYTAFDKIDLNHDGSVSLAELIAAGMDDLAFRAMDINGDGSLSPAEFAKRQSQAPLSGAMPDRPSN